MKQSVPVHEMNNAFEDAIGFCGGYPIGDELPQVGNTDEMALDIFHQATMMPRNSAYAYLHHQISEIDTL